MAVFKVKAFYNLPYLYFVPVPSLPPNVTAGFNTSSKSLYINWTAIPPDFIHGNLLGYTISYQVINSEDSQIAITIDTGPSEMSKEIEELSIYTTYCVRVAGRTRIGAGNWSDCFNITTDDEGKAVRLL